MKTTMICLLLALGCFTVLASADPVHTLMPYMLKPAGEQQHSIDVPLVSFDDSAYEVLKQDALSTTTTEAPSTLEDSTTSVTTPTPATVEATSTTVKSAEDQPKKKAKRHSRKYRSWIL
ncbi:hypothetical protein KR222_007063 [Zaprionus bogoriensis]|nr:hypothetical protein KR222_007063 [Zaprionus bogoriensis]